MQMPPTILESWWVRHCLPTAKAGRGFSPVYPDCVSGIVFSSGSFTTLEAEFADLYAYAKEAYPAEAVIMADAYKYAYNGVNFMTEGYRK